MRAAPLLAAVLTLGLAPAAGLVARAAERSPERVQVADPYLELHTGPGRGFPVFHVAEREEWVEILLRHTDWFKVRTATGREGWVERTQLGRTLTAAGSRRTFRDVALDDFLRRRLELGAGYGRFKAEPLLKVWTSYRLADTLALEASIAQVQGVFSGTDFWHLDLVSEPWSDRRLSPFFAVGVGRFRNIPNQVLVGAQVTDAKLANGMLGLKFHVSERFVARIDYAIYTAFVADTRSTEYRAVSAGMSFFF